jgi:hypothetical protein
MDVDQDGCGILCVRDVRVGMLVHEREERR